MTILLSFLFSPVTVFAGGLQNAFQNGPLDPVRDGSGVPTADLGTIAGTIINTALSLVGIMFLILTVYAGFLWMTARGEEAQVEKATKIIRGSVIGLVITLSAYAITLFLTSRLTTLPSGASGGTTGAPASGGQSYVCVFSLGSGRSQTNVTGNSRAEALTNCSNACATLASHTQVGCGFSNGNCTWTVPGGGAGSRSAADLSACQAICRGVAAGAGSCVLN